MAWHRRMAQVLGRARKLLQRGRRPQLRKRLLPRKVVRRLLPRREARRLLLRREARRLLLKREKKRLLRREVRKLLRRTARLRRLMGRDPEMILATCSPSAELPRSARARVGRKRGRKLQVR